MKKILVSFISSCFIIGCFMLSNVSAFNYVSNGPANYIGWYHKSEENTCRNINNLMYSIVSEGNSYNSWTYSDAVRIQNVWFQLFNQPQYQNTITGYRFTPEGIPTLTMNPYNASGTPS